MKEKRTEKIHLELLDNALDFIKFAAEEAKKDDSKQWKYALINLASGLELLLKAKLEEEHWSLLFSNVDKASVDNLKSGDFLSVDPEATILRLKNIARIELSTTAENDLRAIRNIRNRIIHYSIIIKISELKSLLAKGINFFIEFYKNNFEPYDYFVSDLSILLSGFDKFINERLNSLKKIDENGIKLNNSILCNHCRQKTFIINEDDCECLFCGYSDTLEGLARRVGVDQAIGICPNCKKELLVSIRFSEENYIWRCLKCKFTSKLNDPHYFLTAKGLKEQKQV